MKKGFTLIELLVVVLIIGILSAIALPQYTKAVEKARATEALSNIATMKKQMELYILENGFPTGTNWVQYKDLASVELSGGYWDDDDYYHTKNFEYTGYIYPEGAIIEVYRKNYEYGFWAGTKGNSHLNNDSPVGGWYHACATLLSDKGREICKQYQSLGYKYADAEI